jgi:hypothetical protein
MTSTGDANREAGSVRIIRADTAPETRKRRGLPRGTRIGAIVLAALLSSAGVVVAVELLRNGPPPARTPAAALDARSVPTPDATHLVLVGPRVLADTRSTGALPAGGSVDLPADEVPQGTTALLLEVSVIQAAGPGAVSIESEAGKATVLRAARAGLMTSTTAIVPARERGKLTALTEGGGHLLVNLVGAFVPVEAATAGRVVATPPTEVLRLVPDTAGKDAAIELSAVPTLAAGTYTAVMLQVAADVGRNGGSLAVGVRPDRLGQQVYWAATSGNDRTRAGFMIVPVTGGKIHLHYQAGTLLTVDVVGYITGDTAPRSVAGLVVPVPPGTPEPVQITAGGTVDLPLVAPDGSDRVPAERVAAAFVTLSATGAAVGAVAVHPLDAPPPTNPILSAGGNAARQTSTLVRAVEGSVRVSTAAGASVTVVPQAIVLTG